jgi:tetratricopeptide (TPR) repeat protein
MSLFRWLFHPLLWLLIVLGALAWIYRDSLLSEHGLSSDIQAVGERIEQFFSTAEKDASQSYGSDDEPVQAEYLVPALSDETRVLSLPSRQDPGEEAEPVSVEETVASVAIDESASHKQPVESVPEVVLPLQPEIVRANEGQAIPESTDQEQVDPHTLWHQARAQAWMGEWQASLTSYQQLLKQTPNNYDAYGEMGNVYLRIGNLEEAVAAYSEAALMISRAGYPHVAWNVLGVVSRLDYQQGEALYQALREQQLSSATSQ